MGANSTSAMKLKFYPVFGVIFMVNVSDVFIGSFDQTLAELGNADLAQSLIESGIGIYGHGSGIFNLDLHGWQFNDVMKQWRDTQAPSGVAEFGAGYGYVQTRISVTNNTSSNMQINVGQNLRSSNGTVYEVLANAGQPGQTVNGIPNKNGFVSENGGMGYFILKPGQTIPIDFESTTMGPSGNIDGMNFGDGTIVKNGNTINSIDGISNKDISILNLSSQSSLQGWSHDDLLSYFVNKNGPSPYLYLSQQFGYNPLQGNVNVYGNYLTDRDLSSWKDWVDAARSTGVINLAPIYSINSLDANYAQDFATSNYWQNNRAAALYAGGLSFDAPPSFVTQFTRAWFGAQNLPQDTYVNFFENQIKWANSEGLRTSVIISSYGNSEFSDSKYGGLLRSTQSMISELKANGAMPSQFVVENYGGYNGNEFTTTNDDSLQKVAEWLKSQNFTVASNSESMQEVAGSSSQGYAVHYIMTGIKPSISYKEYFDSINIYDSANVYFGSKYVSQIQGTLTIKLIHTEGVNLGIDIGYLLTRGVAPSQLSLTTNSSEDQLTLVGNCSNMSTVLQGIKFDNRASSLEMMHASLSIDITDGNSQPVHGETQINYTGSGISYFTPVGPVVLTNTLPASIIANIYAQGALFTSLAGSVQAYGYFTDINIYNGGYNTNVAAALTGSGVISNTHNQSGITFASNEASLSVINSIAYVTQGGGTLSVGSGAYVNVKGVFGKNDTLYINGGTVARNAQGSTATVFLNSATFKSSLDNGYTTLLQNMQESSLSYIGNAQAENGLILATNLKSLTDVQVSYADGKALVQEVGANGKIILDNVAKGGISLFSSLNGQNFSTTTSKNILIGRVKSDNNLSISGDGDYNSSSGQSVIVSGGNSTLTVNDLSTRVDIDMRNSLSLHLNTPSNRLIDLILKGVSASDLHVNYSYNDTIIIGGPASITLNGLYKLGENSTSSNGIDLSMLNDTKTISQSIIPIT